MSFGFSPGDIAMFTKFTYKVVSALREEGGSKSEFQFAERQCQSFLAVLNELKSRDLSRIPESFQAQINEYSTTLSEHIEDFQKIIAHYDKSMGKNATGGWFSSAPRKVQWAFMAAEDLAAFRQTLSVQLDLVKIVIQSSILSLISNSSPSTIIFGQGQTMSRRSVLRCEPHEQKLLGWDADAMNEAIPFREIEGLTDLVYKRLLSKPGMSIPPMGIARTLSNDVSVNGVQPEPSQVTNDLTVSTTPNPTAISLSNIQASKTGSKRTGVVAECDETTEYNTLIDDLDEYLQALGLDPLTEEEARYTKKLQRFNTNSVDSSPLLLEASRAETPDLSITLQSRDEGPSQLGSELVTEKPTSHGSGDTSRRQPKPHRRGRFSVPFDFKVDPLSAMGLAASILTLVSLATKLGRTTAHTYGAFGISSNKLISLSRALKHYSAILEAISDILRFSRAETQQDLGLPILYESQALLEGVGRILTKISYRNKSRSKALRNGLKWLYIKDQVTTMIERMDSQKQMLSITLQLHSMEVTYRSTRMLEATSERVELLYRSMNKGEISGPQRNGIITVSR